MKTKFKQAFMDCAITFSGLSSAVRAQVGSIIVKDNRIISIGYNGMPSGWDNECEDTLFSYDERVAHNPLDVREWTYDSTTKQYSALKTKPEVIHAEANALMKLVQSTDSSVGSVLFVTHLPCIECAKLVYQAGIKEVYYINDYHASKGSGHLFLKEAGIKLYAKTN